MHESKSDAILVYVYAFLVTGASAALTIFVTSDLTPLGRHFYESIFEANINPVLGALRPSQVSTGICILLLFLGYFVDLHLLKGPFWPFRTLYAGILGFFFMAAVMLYSDQVPSIPVLVGIGLGMCLVQLLRATSFPNVAAEQFSYFAAVAYATTGQIIFTCWACWAMTNWMGQNTWEWNYTGRQTFSSSKYVRWCSPLLVALVHGLVALFMRWRSLMHLTDDYVLAELKLICSSLVLLFLFTWLAASIAAGDAGLSKVVLRLSVLLSFGAALYLVTTLGPKTIIDVVGRDEKFNMLLTLLMGDWAKGALVLVALPIVPVFAVVEVVHNLVRRTHSPRGENTFITDEALQALRMSLDWDLSSVLTKSMWIGAIYFTLQVGCGRAVVVFLAWVCEICLGYSWFWVLAVLFGVGVALFLLPPVPGCPIYMVSGILITQRFEMEGRHFLLASLVALVISMVTKLTAVALQQKMIGEQFSSSIGVKRILAVHTPEMKAIRHILSQPGLKYEKVIVLVCGPDWPTSVLTGVLRLPVWQMLQGTLPVILLIIPLTLSGSFMVHASRLPEETLAKKRYEGLFNALLVLSMLVQMAGMMLILECTHAVVTSYKDHIERGDWMVDPQEAEVLEAIKVEEKRSKLRSKCTQWSILPWWVRVNLLIGTVLMSLMMYIIILPSYILLIPTVKKPFKDFSLADKFSDLQRHGGVGSLINWPGWLAIAALACSILCLSIFETWCSRVMAQAPDEKLPVLDVQSESTYGGAEGASSA